MIRLLLRPSLFRRLLVIELAGAGLVWMLYTGLVLHSVYEQGSGFLDRDLALVAKSMARLPSSHQDAGGIRHVVEQVAKLNHESSAPQIAETDFAYQLWRADGTLLARSANDPELEPIPPGSVPTEHRSQRGGWIVHGAYSLDRGFFAVAGYSERAVSTLRRQLIVDASLGFLWVIAALSAILWAATRVGLRPLRSLAAKVAARPSGDLTAVRPEPTYAELMPLANALNEKMERIRILLEKERAFFADAAHELRTPLAALEAQAHVLAIQSTPVERDKALRAFEAGVERSAAILNKLLLLARLDGQAGIAAWRRADVPAILRGQVAQHAPRLLALGSRIELDVPESAVLECDPAAIEVAVEHLIDNCARHTAGGSRVVVGLVAQADTVVISVTDDGPGIPEHERERVFDRFVRLDSASAGSGLGLAIVRNIARMHGGEASVHTGEGGRGVRFEIRIPSGKRS